MKKWFFLLAMIPILGFSQHRLTVMVEGVKSSEGNISIGLYNQVDGFLKPEKGFLGLSVKAVKGTTTALIENLPYGSYAIAVFHDENGNQKMDTNFFGIPKEALGFSIGKLKTFGPPSYKECAFSFTGDMEVKVPIE